MAYQFLPLRGARGRRLRLKLLDEITAAEVLAMSAAARLNALSAQGASQDMLDAVRLKRDIAVKRYSRLSTFARLRLSTDRNPTTL